MEDGVYEIPSHPQNVGNLTTVVGFKARGINTPMHVHNNEEALVSSPEMTQWSKKLEILNRCVLHLTLCVAALLEGRGAGCQFMIVPQQTLFSHHLWLRGVINTGERTLSSVFLFICGM